MGHDCAVGLSYVTDAGEGCLIYRETTGRYVVRPGGQGRQSQRVATLASAYAACQVLSGAAESADKPVSDLR
jgi:hypothetical protein